ncbi:MAG: PH domain-containing protein [Methanomassiliicoccaceae archaeon]|nr:PH domain-containing protein [Methanomassiliicoccaceae archaeon]
MRDENTYRSKLGALYYLIPLVILGVMFLPMYHLISNTAIFLIVSIAILVLFISIETWGYRKLRYMIRENDILIEAPWLKTEIEYASITCIEEASSLREILKTIFVTGTVISLDQIKITCYANLGKGSVSTHIFISPKKKEEFLSKVATKLSDPNTMIKKG